VYLIRNIQENKNPYPASYGLAGGDDIFIRDSVDEYDKKYQVFVDMFRPRSSMKRK